MRWQASSLVISQYFIQFKPSNVNKLGGLFFICCKWTCGTS